jgi:hypothetical protein
MVYQVIVIGSRLENRELPGCRALIELDVSRYLRFTSSPLIHFLHLRYTCILLKLHLFHLHFTALPLAHNLVIEVLFTAHNGRNRHRRKPIVPHHHRVSRAFPHMPLPDYLTDTSSAALSVSAANNKSV